MTSTPATFQNTQENAIKALAQFYSANFDYQTAINMPVESLVFNDVNYRQIVAILKEGAIEEEEEEIGEKRAVVSFEDPTTSVQILSDETPVAVEKSAKPPPRRRGEETKPKQTSGYMDRILLVSVGVLAVLFFNR